MSSHPESIDTLNESEESQWMELAMSEDSQRHETAENTDGIQSFDLSEENKAAKQQSDSQSTRSDMQHLLSLLR